MGGIAQADESDYHRFH
eukprot:gene18116-23770_t